jgi:hypothetical protein
MTLPTIGPDDGSGATQGIPQTEPSGWPLLGALLVAEGLVSETDVAYALDVQKKNGKKLGEILLESEMVSRFALARVLALQGGVTLDEETGYGSGLRGAIERRLEKLADDTDTAGAEAPVLLTGPRQPPREAVIAPDDGPLTPTDEPTLPDTSEQPIDTSSKLAAEWDTPDLRPASLTEMRQIAAETDGPVSVLEHHAASIHRLDADFDTGERLLALINKQQAALSGLQERAEHFERSLSQFELLLADLDGALARQGELLIRGSAALAKLHEMQDEQLQECRRLEHAVSEREHRLAQLRQQLTEKDTTAARLLSLGAQFDRPAARGALAAARYPLIDLCDQEIDYGVARFFPQSAAHRYGALPIRYEQGVVIVAMAAPDESRVRAVHELIDRDASFFEADPVLLNAAIKLAYHGDAKADPAAHLTEGPRQAHLASSSTLVASAA